MTAFFGVLRRDVQVAVATPLLWVVACAFLLLCSTLFWLELAQFEALMQRALLADDPELLSLLDFNDLVIASLLSHVQVVLLFLVPLLSMRVFAEDRHDGLLDVLVASPASRAALVLGKVAAIALQVCGLCALLLVYPLVLAFFGQAVVAGDAVVDTAQLLCGLFGVTATALLYVSIGSFISACTSSQALAALSTFLVLSLLWFSSSLGPVLGGASGALLSWLSPGSHMERLARGVVDGGDVSYFVTSPLVFLALCRLALQPRGGS